MVLEAIRVDGAVSSASPSTRHTSGETVTESLHGLHPKHLHELEVGSAIPVKILAEEGVRSLDGAYQLPEPDPALRHPNAAKARRIGQHPDVLGPGIYFPIRDAEGHATYQMKPDHPRSRDGKVVKYESAPGARLVVHVPIRVRPVLHDPSVPLRVTEGPKKVLSAVAAGFPTIGLMGVSGWRMRLDAETSVPLPDLDEIEWRGRIVYVEFDSDVSSKASVKDALDALTHELRWRGAMPVTVTFPDGPNGEKQGVDDFLAAGGDLRALENAALFKALGTTTQGGSDGEQTCASCVALRAQVKELKAADELVRFGPFTPNEAQVHRHLAVVADAARKNGREKVPLWREEVARLSLNDPKNLKAVTRAWAIYEPYQKDPELAATLPYRLVKRPRGEDGKDHMDLYPTTTEEPISLAQAYMALRRLPRDLEQRPRAGGDQRGKRRDACPRCDGPMRQTGTRACMDDDCGCVIQTKTRTVGRAPSESEHPGQNVPLKYGGETSEQPTDPGQNVPGPQTPTSFVSQDDQLLADAPHYRTTSDDDASDLTDDDPTLADAGDDPPDDPTSPDPPNPWFPECEPTYHIPLVFR